MGKEAAQKIEAPPPIIKEGQPVITSKSLAVVYGVTEKMLRNNYLRNRDRFIEGKHFFKIVGEDVKALYSQASLRGSQVSTQARNLLLWTTRGAARHAKMLNTNQAWDVFEKLEDCYFEANQPKPKAKPVQKVKALPAPQGGLVVGIGKAAAAHVKKARKYITGNCSDKFIVEYALQMMCWKIDEVRDTGKPVPLDPDDLKPLNKDERENVNLEAVRQIALVVNFMQENGQQILNGCVEITNENRQARELRKKLSAFIE